ncbi:zinc finger BED domain-containing 4 [Brachionus plicatilis]|uniref:Zinc finger BED domain-containing 4 n=1 Tax=Brachionus plicatilis TaxID=10195 RepID=A0A3M7QUG0_BRAPC|nr:zinc finger BED domain-containing 4 [Brachionus plicatilis]
MALKNNSRKRKRDKISWVWKFFEYDKTTEIAKCTRYSFSRKHNNSTTYLRNNLATLDIFEEKSQEELKIAAAVFSDSGEEYSSDSNGESNDERIKKAKFSENKAMRLKEKLINFLVLTNQPASLVENKVFRDFCKELNSSYQPPCRNTFNNIINF